MKKIVLTLLCFMFLSSTSLANDIYRFSYRAIIATQGALVIQSGPGLVKVEQKTEKKKAVKKVSYHGRPSILSGLLNR